MRDDQCPDCGLVGNEHDQWRHDILDRVVRAETLAEVALAQATKATPSAERAICGYEFNGFSGRVVCNREKGHDGDHWSEGPLTAAEVYVSKGYDQILREEKVYQAGWNECLAAVNELGRLCRSCLGLLIEPARESCLVPEIHKALPEAPSTADQNLSAGVYSSPSPVASGDDAGAERSQSDGPPDADARSGSGRSEPTRCAPGPVVAPTSTLTCKRHGYDNCPTCFVVSGDTPTITYTGVGEDTSSPSPSNVARDDVEREPVTSREKFDKEHPETPEEREARWANDLSAFRPEAVAAVRGALESFSSINHGWEPGSKHNLLMTILGSLGYALGPDMHSAPSAGSADEELLVQAVRLLGDVKDRSTTDSHHNKDEWCICAVCAFLKALISRDSQGRESDG